MRIIYIMLNYIITSTGCYSGENGFPFRLMVFCTRLQFHVVNYLALSTAIVRVDRSMQMYAGRGSAYCGAY